MPRPKGSKNKKKSAESIQLSTLTVEEIDARIASTNEEIESLTEQLKAKRVELKDLFSAREAAEAAEAARKAEEEKATILAAIAASGKSMDEILALLKPVTPPTEA